MKTVEMYENELTGAKFDTAEKAIASENKSKRLNKIFDLFFLDIPKTMWNGNSCIQRDKVYYENFKAALCQAVREFEPWIAADFEREGYSLEECMLPGAIIGRYLDDSGGDIYSWFSRWSCICSHCYKEWDQPYYSNNCLHRDGPIRY